MTEKSIGIYAGKGVLPIKVAESITKSNKEVFIIAIKGLTDKNIEKFPHQWMRFGQIGLAMNMLKKNNCNELVIIGGGYLFKETLPVMNKLVITKVDCNVLGDIYYPTVEMENWKLVNSESYKKNADNDFDFKIEEYEKL